MKSTQNRRRYLSYYFPDVINRSELPVNYDFAQFYSLYSEDDAYLSSDKNDFSIKVKDYATDHFEIMSTLGKPISKIIK